MDHSIGLLINLRLARHNGVRIDGPDRSFAVLDDVHRRQVEDLREQETGRQANHGTKGEKHPNCS